MRERYHPDHGMIPIYEWERIKAGENKRSALPMPYVVSDHLADVVNPVDNKPYDSKSAYYRTVKDAGCEIMGSDSATTKRPEPQEVGGVEQDIKRAIEELS